MFTIIPRGSINIKWWIRRQAETQHDESPCKSDFFDLQGLSYMLTLQWTIPPDESLFVRFSQDFVRTLRYSVDLPLRFVAYHPPSLHICCSGCIMFFAAKVDET